MSILKDNDWIRQSFMLPAGSISDVDAVRRTMKDASIKFTDSSLGGNFAINPPPQFTPTADLVVDGKYINTIGGGQGRYYSEAIDNNSTLIHMRFGVPKYNSLTNFFGTFYSSQAASLANTGRGNGIIFNVFKALGHVVAIPFAPFILANKMINYFMSKPLSKFYYLKPTMPLYWNAVQTIVNSLAVNMGLARAVSSPSEQELYHNETNFGKDDVSSYIANMSKGAFDFWTEGGTIDILKVANRAQILANEQRNAIAEAFENAETNSDLSAALLEYIDTPERLEIKKEFESHTDYRDSYLKLVSSTWDADTAIEADRLGSTTDNDSTGTSFWLANRIGDTIESIGSQAEAFATFTKAEFQDGSQFVTFRVDNPGTVNESFSNSTKESGIASALNSATSTGRAARFNFADGNTGIGFIDAVTSAARDAVNGLIEGVQLSGLTAFTGSAFADVPKTWDGSTANLPRADYTIELRSWAGNKLSRFTNLYVPLAMLLAGALPLSTGKQSYTSPFICELYSQGRNQIRTGMIESLSITRGSGNIGWTADGEPLGIDVTFSVVDMSTIMHVPIHTGIDASETVPTAVAAAAAAITGGAYGVVAGASAIVDLATKGMFDDDNTFTDYMDILGGLSLSDQVYPWRKLKIRAAKRMTDIDTWASSANAANFLMGVPLARTLSGIAVGTSK